METNEEAAYELGYSRGYATGNRNRGERWKESFLSARMLIGYDIKEALELEYRQNVISKSAEFKRGYLQAISDIEKLRFLKDRVPPEPSAKK